MRVFVTGHCGYIGTVMAPMLLEAGHDVFGCDTDLYRRCTLASGGEIAEIQNLSRDIRDLETADLLGFDAVIHLAGLSNDPLGDLNPQLTDDINHLATIISPSWPSRLACSDFSFPRRAATMALRVII